MIGLLSPVFRFLFPVSGFSFAFAHDRLSRGFAPPSPGGYRFTDFLRIGWALVMVTIPMVFPLR